MVTLKYKFGRRLRQLRRQYDLTQEQLSEHIQTSVETVSNIERGIHAPSFETLDKLSAALKIPVHIFFMFPAEDNHIKE